MRSSKNITLRSLVITTSICVITLSLLLGSELALRYLSPQLEQRLVWNGMPGTAPDKDLRHVLAPNYHGVTYSPEFYPHYRVEYQTNAQGLRDERTYGERISRDTVRILILGDSFAYGVANNYSEIWPAVLEKQLANARYKVEVIKAGVFGYDTRQEILYLKRLFPQYKPDIVILAFLLNDLFTNVAFSPSGSESHEGDVIRASLTAQKIGNLHLLTLVKRLLLKNDALYTKLYLGTQRSTFFDVHSAVLQRQLNITKSLLLEARSYAAQNSFKFVVVSIPQAFQVINTDKNIDVSFVDKELGHFANEADFLWISSVPFFLESYTREREDLHYRLDGHLNPKGNRIVGNLLATRFRELLNSKNGSQVSRPKGLEAEHNFTK